MHATKKARIASICSAVVLVGVQLLSPFAIFVPKAAADSYVNNGKITICHRTDSYSNPYEQITVDTSAADGSAGNSGGEADHYGEHQGPVFYPTIPKHTEWGDIIPPIPGTPDENGLNWTNQDGTANVDGQAIWKHECNVPDSGSVTVNKCVDELGNNQYICDNQLANKLGFQWSFNVATLSWNDMGTTVGDVAQGDQSVVENQVSGYSFTGWYKTGDKDRSCTNPEDITQPIDITVKKDTTTEITLCNQADPNGSITLIKKVIEDNGGTAGVDAFGLSIGGTSVKSGETLSLPAGDYSIDEVGKTGYKFVSITGDNCPTDLGGTVSLAYGENVTCTITNDDIAGQLKVIKDVVNDYNGTAKPSDFTMYVNGNAVDQNKYISENAGTYSITESGPSGYKQVGIACVDDTTLQTVSYPVSLGLAQSVTCTVTNEDQPASLTIVKVATPLTDQSFSFTSPNPELGTFGLVGDGGDRSYQKFDNLSAGNYTFNEIATDNWSNEGIGCSNEQYASDASKPFSLYLDIGTHITCFVYNTELATITGHKFNDVNNNHVWDNGEPTLKNWTITLTGCVNSDGDAVSLLCTNKVSRTTTTDANGAYSFAGLEPGTYTVCEVQQATWTQTYPQTSNGCHEITIDVEQYGEVFTADFGNHPNPQVLGSSTTKLLVNTGMDASRNVMVGLIILSLLGSIHFLGARKKYNA